MIALGPHGYVMPAPLASWKPRLRKLPGFRAARFLVNLVKSQESRNAALLQLRPPRGLYQPYGTTSPDRYPEVFSQVRRQVEDGAAVRILSFGCSTGEEIFSLRRYFPEAYLAGLDINPLNISACRSRVRKKADGRTVFAVAGSTAGEASASYDVVFAMAVFRHGHLNIAPPPSRCDQEIRFADFEQSVADLARVLKPGGLLAIGNAMFRFCDTRVAQDFEAVFAMKTGERAPLYGRDNCLLPEAEYPDLIFRKLR